MDVTPRTLTEVPEPPAGASRATAPSTAPPQRGRPRRGIGRARGWILGIVVLASGFGIFTGNAAARTVGVIVAALSAVANFLWLPWYPIWGGIVIALDVAIIWALTAHGRDIQRISDGA